MSVNGPLRIPIGCRSIDKALDGGLLIGSINLMYGEPETGKTTMAIQCAVNCARRGYKTLFIDCDSTFSSKRLAQIASKNLEKIAESIFLMRPENFKEQTLVMEKLPNYLTEKFGLAVVDTITSFYRVEVAESPKKTFELNRELNRQLALLAQIAKTQKIAVLLTSQVRSVLNETYESIEPVATRVLKFWAEVIIAMRPTEKPQIIKAILEKAPNAAQYITWFLRIGEGGLYECLHL
jgi:RecA/RadA recombinase